ncbi:hypothetical protein MAR_004319, partial [Mya arenaria]
KADNYILYLAHVSSNRTIGYLAVQTTIQNESPGPARNSCMCGSRRPFYRNNSSNNKSRRIKRQLKGFRKWCQCLRTEAWRKNNMKLYKRAII